VNSPDIRSIYADLRQAAVDIAATYPRPDFYSRLSDSVEFSRRSFEKSGFLKSLLVFVDRQTSRNMGHDLAHARSVALDAGTIAAEEAAAAGCSGDHAARLIFLAHCAGLLHDVRRAYADHAKKGAEVAACELRRSGMLEDHEIELVAFAIRNHEAFKPCIPPGSLECHIVSGSLYDSDKFRWGPDNFTQTVWKMLDEAPWPLSKFAALYPDAMAHIESIKSTFRTATGKTYGPQFIEIGIKIGRELMAVAKERYGHLL